MRRRYSLYEARARLSALVNMVRAGRITRPCGTSRSGGLRQVKRVPGALERFLQERD